jgi:hypothetical protein
MDTRLVVAAAVVAALALLILILIGVDVRRRWGRRGRLASTGRQRGAVISPAVGDAHSDELVASVLHEEALARERTALTERGIEATPPQHPASQHPAPQHAADGDPDVDGDVSDASETARTALADREHPDDVPTPPEGGSTAATAADDPQLRTDRLQVRSEAGGGRPADEDDPTAETNVIPVVETDADPAADTGSTPHRHFRPDDVAPPALIADAVGETGGGRHRAATEPEPEPQSSGASPSAPAGPDPAQHDPLADHEPTEPRGEPVVPERPHVQPRSDGRFGIPTFELPEASRGPVEPRRPLHRADMDPQGESADDSSTELTTAMPHTRSDEGDAEPSRRTLADRLRGRQQR